MGALRTGRARRAHQPAEHRAGTPNSRRGTPLWLPRGGVGYAGRINPPNRAIDAKPPLSTTANSSPGTSAVRMSIDALMMLVRPACPYGCVIAIPRDHSPMIGNKMCEGWFLSRWRVLRAGCVRVCCPIASPVLGLMSKRGKLLLEISTLMR